MPRWIKTFAVFRNELTNKKYPLYQRMRLFNAVITPTVLYGSGSWVMTKTREQKLRSTQRKMLRSILGKGRAVLQTDSSDTTSSGDSSASSHSEDKLESWVEWVQRVTEEAETVMKKVGVPDWVEEHYRRKWKWCGHVCRREDGRWCCKVLAFSPTAG